MTIADCAGKASATARVEVAITHPYRGDVVVDLLAPDGSVYKLKAMSGSDSADNVNAAYQVNLSAEASNGTWKLRVQDMFRGDVGTLENWKLTV